MKTIMKTVFILIIACFLGTCCYPNPKTNYSKDTIEHLEFVTELTKEIYDAVDILADDSLSVEERVRLYHKRMNEINKKLKDRGKQHEPKKTSLQNSP